MDNVVHILRFLLSSADDNCEEPLNTVYHSLKALLRDKMGIRNLNGLKKYLQENDDIFDEDLLLDESLVVPRTSLKLCPRHSTKSGSCDGSYCGELHFCKFYLLSGSCQHGSGCLFGHSLETRHNRGLLRQHGLFGLSLTEMRRLFTLPQSRCDITRPSVCRYYNMHRGCSKGKNCRSLHVCAYYVGEGCKFAKHCKRNHHMNDSQVKSNLELFGINTKRPMKEILEEIREYDTTVDDCDDYGSRSRARSVPPGSKYWNMASSPQDFVGARATSSSEEEEDERRSRGPMPSRSRQQTRRPPTPPPGRAASRRQSHMHSMHRAPPHSLNSYSTLAAFNAILHPEPLDSARSQRRGQSQSVVTPAFPTSAHETARKQCLGQPPPVAVRRAANPVLPSSGPGQGQGQRHRSINNNNQRSNPTPPPYSTLDPLAAGQTPSPSEAALRQHVLAQLISTAPHPVTRRQLSEELARLQLQLNQDP